MKIRTFIAIFAGSLICVFLAGALVATSRIDRIRLGGPLQLQQQQTSDYIADILPPPEYIIEPYLEATLVAAHPETVDARTDRLRQLQHDYDERHRYWLASTIDPALRAMLTDDAHRPAARFWEELNARFLPAARSGRRGDLDSSYGRLAADYTAHRHAIDRAVAHATSFQAVLVDGSKRELSSALWTLGGICGALFLSLAGFFWAIHRRAVGPLAATATAMQRLSAGDLSATPVGDLRRDEIGDLVRSLSHFRQCAVEKRSADAALATAHAQQRQIVDTVSTHLSDLSDGDLTASITTDFPSDYASLKTNFNEALGKLRELIGSVGESATTIRTGSTEIAQASEDLARRTESNAASLEETAASVTQMDGRLRASAAAASRTVERADQAIATVGGGRAVADEAVQAMGRVSDSAKGIDSVIEGLDKIAFQTRVLAMNAAVEAGRAGDAGRGFAVVADLVSALAMRAEEEAKRARDQLTVTQTDIVTAVEAVTKVDGALADISGDVGQVHELLATMAADNQAQSAAITQISAAIGTMDQSTQQNAAMVEETSAAARNLTSEVSSLTDKAGRFKVDDGRYARPSPTPARKSEPARKMVDARTYASPVKALPAAGIAALVRTDDDWNDF